MRPFIQDVRYALRQLRKYWGFALVVVLTLALGIGANTAVFSVMNAILMQFLPVQRPEGLFYVSIANGQGNPPNSSNTGSSDTSFPEVTFEQLRQRKDVLEELIGYVPLSYTGSVAVRHGDLPEEAKGEEVSGNFFSGLGARIGLGRGFTLDDEKKHSMVVVLSYDYWAAKFASDQGVLGHTLFVKGVPMTIVGVAGKGFKGIEPATATDFWIPFQNNPVLNAWGAPTEYSSFYGSPKWWFLRMMARVRPGISSLQAQEALAGSFSDSVEKAIGKVDPKQWKPLLDFIPARGIAGYNDEFREPVQILMGLVALVLLIACTNVGMMVQARNTVRQREFSLRMALGASQASIFRQLLSESMILVACGAALGWILALAATRGLSVLSGVETGFTPDTKVLLFTLVISALAALVFGLVPLWTAVHAPVAGVLRANATNMTANRSQVLGGRVVLALQIAICLVLLVSAGLLLRTLNNYASQDLGFTTEGLLVFDVTPQGQTESHVFYRTLLDRLRQLPGVESVSMVSNRPGSGWSNNNDLMLDGVEQQGFSLRSNDIGAGFFQTMGTPVLQGRDFLNTDTKDTPRVAIVNESFVKRLLSKTNPIGHRIGGRNPAAIVGVVGDSKYTSVSETPRPMAYFAQMQAPVIGTMSIEVRTRGDARSLLGAMRKTIAMSNPDIPLQNPMTQEAQFELSYQRQRMFAAMGGFFGLLAAVLVATGLYGTHSFRVNRRTNEIGVRMALGATRAQVLTMVMRESFWILLAGLVIGLPLTYAAVRPLGSMLHKMSAVDPFSYVAAIGAMILVANVAALLPARRAASVEPMQALRSE